MDEEARGQEHEPKFSDLEVILGGLILFTADIISIVILFIGLDDFWIIDTLVGVPLAVYYYAKGLYGTSRVAGKAVKKYLPRIVGQFAGELVPYIGALPLYSGIFGWIVWTDRHPELEAVVEKIGSVKGGGAGAVKGAEGAAAKGAAGAVAVEQRAAEGVSGVAAEGAETAAGEAEAAGGAGGAAKGKKTSEEGVAGHAQERPRQGLGGEEGAEGGEEEGEEEPLTLEEQRERNAARGLSMEDLKLDIFSPEQMTADVGTPTLGAKVLKFDPNRAMNPEMKPKPAKKWAERDNKNTKGIIDKEQIDLKNPKEPKRRELLADAPLEKSGKEADEEAA